MASLQLVRDKPAPKGKQIARDANDVLSSFPGQKDIRQIASPKLQNQKGNAGKGKWR